MGTTYSVGAFRILRDPPYCGGFAGSTHVVRTPYRPHEFDEALELAEVTFGEEYFEILELHENVRSTQVKQLEKRLSRKYLQ